MSQNTTGSGQLRRIVEALDGKLEMSPGKSSDKLLTTFLAAMAEDFEKYGAVVIQEIRDDNPVAYAKLCASILPKQVSVKVDPEDEMTDEQLLDRAQKLITALNLGAKESGPDGPEPDADGAAGAAGAQSPRQLPPIP